MFAQAGKTTNDVELIICSLPVGAKREILNRDSDDNFSIGAMVALQRGAKVAPERGYGSPPIYIYYRHGELLHTTPSAGFPHIRAEQEDADKMQTQVAGSLGIVQPV